jgi:hypothetical protein
MSPARLRLKKSTGWFAAGQEVAAALEILSDAAFKLHVYLCLNADRRAGRMVADCNELACRLQTQPQPAMQSLDELCRREVRWRRGGSDTIMVEIRDRFWPYEKAASLEPALDQAEYIREARRMLTAPVCVRAAFTAADQRLAAGFHQSGVPLMHAQRAIWLGCARKYIALLNGQTPMLVASPRYFTNIVDEVAGTDAGDGYWGHVRSKARQLERRWIEIRSRERALPHPRNEMMETK